MSFLMKPRAIIRGVFLAISLSSVAHADDFISPEILILGDSQISFGSGPAFLEFFTDIKQHCHANATQARNLKQLGKMRVGVIGVRSSSIHSWTARSGRSKDTICKEDRKWRVNAGTYGFINMTGNKYVQIGKGREYQFCTPKKSAFEYVATKLKCPMLRKVEMSHQALTVARLCSPETLSIGGRRSLAAVMVKVGKEPKPTKPALPIIELI